MADELVKRDRTMTIEEYIEFVNQYLELFSDYDTLPREKIEIDPETAKL